MYDQLDPRLVSTTAILLIACLLFLAVAPVLATPAQSLVVEAVVRGQRVTVFQNTEVTVYVKVKTVGFAVKGELKVEVRKDIIWSSDQVHKTLTKTIEVPADTTTDWINVGSFIATDLSGTWPGSFRHYFIKVWFEGNLIYDPTDPATRPCVATKPGGPAEALSFYSVEFEGIG